jgi:tetratricopeptide (TPR) repeat protein
MAQPATTPKIEELRLRLKTDPKSRIFYPLAEELRKVGQFAESDHVLRTGLVNHPTYLSAWVSLGRVSRELKNEPAAVEALNKALQLDQGNVVAARLLADSYLALGERLEALKKYKLVHALLPGDEELEATIEHLDNELNPVTIAPIAMAEPEPEPEAPVQQETSPFEETQPVVADTGDSEPMHAAHIESPFEDPVGDTFTAATFEVEAPAGIHIEPEPEPEPVVPPEDEVSHTLTMADLYARQGLTDDARHIYESILQRDPENAAVREKLEALNPPPPPAPAAPAPAAPSGDSKVARLEGWLAKVGRREESHV